VIVTVDVAAPSAVTGPDPVMVELSATAASAVNKTDPSDLETGLVMVRVLDSALGELNVQVEIPAALVTEQVP
jgi:hypothetical protein